MLILNININVTFQVEKSINQDFFFWEGVGAGGGEHEGKEI